MYEDHDNNVSFHHLLKRISREDYYTVLKYITILKIHRILHTDHV